MRSIDNSNKSEVVLGENCLDFSLKVYEYPIYKSFNTGGNV
jgi:hypothetical protein